MTPEQAAWVRDHVWTGAMRKTYGETPGFYTRCACQSGATTWCADLDRHDRCHRGTPLGCWETLICWPDGQTPAMFAEPYRHPTISATGPHHHHFAMVWLADRICRWVCPCPCHTTPAPPQQLDLFEGAP